MATTSIFFSDSISDLSGYWLCAEARLGNNGDYFGPQEVVIKKPDGQEVQRSSLQWDTDDSDGIDSGLCAFSLAAEDGVLTWSVNGYECRTVSEAQPPFENVHKVLIRAAANGIGLFEFQGLSVKFYKDNALIDSYDHTENLGVDTRYASAPSAERTIEVFPTSTDCDEVLVTGFFRMLAPEISSQDQVYGQVALYTSA
jgi:hypothetical protein